MKKLSIYLVLVLLLGFILSCSVSSKDTSLENTVTYTDPDVTFIYPQNLTIVPDVVKGTLITLRDKQSTLIVYKLPTKGMKTFAEYHERYPVMNHNIEKPFVFMNRTLGNHTFSYTQTERFEGTLSFDYYIIHRDILYRFVSVGTHVAWTDPKLDTEAEVAHTLLRNVLSTLSFENK